MEALTVILLLVLLVVLGVPIAISLGVASVAGLVLLYQTPDQLMQIGRASMEELNFVTTSLPLYVLLGELLLFSGAGNAMFEAAEVWLRRLPGGLGVATVLGSAMLAGINGSSTASIVTLGPMALARTEAAGYRPRMTLGALAGSGTLGILIPPSISMILYSSATGVSLGKLFEAGFVPGVVLTLMMAGWIVLSSALAEGHGGRSELRGSGRALAATVAKAAPGVIGIAIVLGSVYSGFATPTESAGLGILYGLGLVGWNLVKRGQWKDLKGQLSRAASTSAMMMFIVVMAGLFSHVLTLLELPQSVSGLLVDLPFNRWDIYAIIMAILALLGLFLNPGAIILIVIPLVYPVVTKLGFDGVWFGILVIVNMELATLHPPIGINLFVLRAVSAASSVEIITSVVPYWVIISLAIAVFSVFPEVVTFLPSVLH